MSETPFTEIKYIGECNELAACSLCEAIFIDPMRDPHLIVTIGDNDPNVVAPLPLRAMLCNDCAEENREALWKLTQSTRDLLVSLRPKPAKQESSTGKPLPDIPRAVIRERLVTVTKAAIEDERTDGTKSRILRQLMRAYMELLGIDELPDDIREECGLPITTTTWPSMIVERQSTTNNKLYSSFTPREETETLAPEKRFQPLGTFRRINEEEFQLLMELYLEDGQSEEEAIGTINNFYFGVIDQYISDCPGYTGKVIIGVFGSPELISIYLQEKETGKLVRIQPEG